MKPNAGIFRVTVFISTVLSRRSRLTSRRGYRIHSIDCLEQLARHRLSSASTVARSCWCRRIVHGGPFAVPTKERHL